MYINRKLERLILKYLEVREIIAIIGPRQSGKTTLLKKIQSGLKDSIFLSFEDFEDLELFEKDIKSFAKKYFGFKYIFIDEFQYSKNGGRLLKYLYDTFPENKLIISGSSSIDLTIHAIKYLVGRLFVFSLYQLDFEEYLSYSDPSLYKVIKPYKEAFDLSKGKITKQEISNVVNKSVYKILTEFILWGGYPRVAVSNDHEEKRIILKNIYNTYFLREIRDTLGLIDDFKLSKLLRGLSIQIGQLVSYNELSKFSEYDYLTLKKYLNFLEKTFIINSLKPYFNNRRKEITKNPKIYFYDTGLRNYVINDFNNLENRLDQGFLYENYVFNQLQKNEIACNFWRTKTQNEIDFTIELDKKMVPIEIKSKYNPIHIPKSLDNFMKEYKSSYGILLTENIDYQSAFAEKKIYVLPHWII